MEEINTDPDKRPEKKENVSSYLMVDEAKGNLNQVLDEVKDLKKASSDTEEKLNLRLEAFEDIIASEVGDTAMVRARNIEREMGVRQIFLKFEGGNPSGTQKDRIAFAQVQDALRQGFDTLCFATCGNYGVAVAFAACLAGMNCCVFIPESYHTFREAEIRKWGGRILKEGRDYEEAVDISSEYAYTHGYYDANPGGVNTNLQLQAYSEIAYEIFDDLRDAPAAVAVPVSNGTTITGIYRGFQKLYRRGKTSRIPKIIAGSSSFKNPITVSFKKGLSLCEDLEPARIKESRVNEPLINWHSIDGTVALEAIYKSEGWASDGSDRKMTYYSNFIKKNEGLSVLPASTAGLIALIDFYKKFNLKGDRYVAVLTGRK